jgi:hypothetical protein
MVLPTHMEHGGKMAAVLMPKTVPVTMVSSSALDCKFVSCSDSVARLS